VFAEADSCWLVIVPTRLKAWNEALKFWLGIFLGSRVLISGNKAGVAVGGIKSGTPGGASNGIGGPGKPSAGGIGGVPPNGPGRPSGGAGSPGQPKDPFHNIQIVDLIDLALQPHNIVKTRGPYTQYNIPAQLTTQSGKTYSGTFEIGVEGNRLTHYFFKPGKY
jgi:hypothetical protein